MILDEKIKEIQEQLKDLVKEGNELTSFKVLICSERLNRCIGQYMLQKNNFSPNLTRKLRDLL